MMKNVKTDWTILLATFSVACLAAGIAGFLWFGNIIGIALVAAAAVMAIIAALQGRNQVLRNMDEQTRQSTYKFDTKKWIVCSIFAACAVFAVAILLAPVNNWFILVPCTIAGFNALYICHRKGKNFALIAAMMIIMMLGTTFGTFAIEKTEGAQEVNIGGIEDLVSQDEEGNIILTPDKVVTPELEVKGDANVDGDLNAKGNQTVNGNSTIKGNQTVNGNSTIKGNQTVNGNSTIKGDQTVQGNQTIKGDQTVQGNQTIKGDQTVEGDVNVKGDLNVEGDANVKGDLNVEGDANINGDVNVGGNVNTTAPAPTAPQTTKPAPTEPTTKAPETTKPAPTEPTTKVPETTKPAPTEPAKNPQINCKGTIRYGETLYINLVDIDASNVKISNKAFLSIQQISNSRIAITLNEDVTGYITITDSVSGVNRVIDIIE